MFSLNGKLYKTKWTQTMDESQEEGQDHKRKRIECGESGPMEIDRPIDELIPLKMGSIQQIIFGFLDVESLKAARQVNKPWSIEGAKILLKKCYVKLPSDLHDAESSTKDETMKKFKAFLAYKSSDVSMIPNIIIETEADFKMWKSLGVLGPQVNSVMLSSTKDKGRLLKKLLDLLPNLKYLRLIRDQSLNESNDILKILRYIMLKPEKNGNPLIISGMFVEPDNQQEFEELEKFADCSNIKFEELWIRPRSTLLTTIPQHNLRFGVIVSKLLSTSQSTLYSLDLHRCETQLSFIEFPCLPALQVLVLLFERPAPGATAQIRFSSDFRFTEKVPNLYHFYFDHEQMPSTPDAFAHLFENTGSAPSVNALTCIESRTEFPIEALFQTFPNTKSFCFEPSQHQKRTFYNVCKHGKKVESLTISVNSDGLRYLSHVADLDSMLTGFSPKTVDRIKNGGDDTINNVEELRVNPSILDLKALKNVKIHFDGSRLNLLPERSLAIAAEYAFKLMPTDFKVMIYFAENPAPPIKHARTALAEASKLKNVTLHLATKAWMKENFFPKM